MAVSVILQSAFWYKSYRMHCDHCDIAIDEPPEFAVVRRSFRTTKQTLCKYCRLENERRVHESNRWLALLFIPLALLIARDHPTTGSVALSTLLIPIGVIIHEIGHIAAGCIVGVRPMNFSIGAGRRFLNFWLGNVLVELRWRPICGHVLGICLSCFGYRTRMIFYLAGGMLANLITVTVVGLILTKSPSSRWPIHANWTCIFTSAMGWANMWGLLGSLIPYRAGCDRCSDGMRIFQILRSPSPSIEMLERMHLQTRIYLLCNGRRTSEAHALLMREFELYPGDKTVLASIGCVLIKQGKFESAIEIFRQMIDVPWFDSKQQAAVLNSLAWAEMLTGDEGQLEAANAHSAQAIALRPTSPFIRGTRGAVLVQGGERSWASLCSDRG